MWPFFLGIVVGYYATLWGQDHSIKEEYIIIDGEEYIIIDDEED